MANARSAPRRPRGTTASSTRRARPGAGGTGASRKCAVNSKGKVSRFPNKGTCPACGKVIERNPESIAVCDCWSKCSRCGGDLTLLHKLMDKTVATYRRMFRLGRDVVGFCPNCIQETLALPARKGVSRKLPQVVQLSKCSGPASSKPMHSVGALSGRSPVPKGRGAETFYKGGDSHSQ